MLPDHYQALGVHPLADHATIRAAYRRLMRDVHPDVRPDDPAAAEAARRATAAWTVLSHSARRASYDRLLAVRVGGVRTPRRPPQAWEQQPEARARPVERARAYSADGVDYRAAFHRATLRLGTAVVALGVVLLLVVR